MTDIEKLKKVAEDAKKEIETRLSFWSGYIAALEALENIQNPEPELEDILEPQLVEQEKIDLDEYEFIGYSKNNIIEWQCGCREKILLSEKSNGLTAACKCGKKYEIKVIKNPENNRYYYYFKEI